MHGIFEALWSIVVTLYYLMEGLIYVFIPVNLLPKKSVKDQIVLVTGAGKNKMILDRLRVSKTGAYLIIWHNTDITTVAEIPGSPAALFHFGMDVAGDRMTIKKCQRTQLAGDRFR